MEIEKLNLYRDTNWNDIKLRFCGHSECLPLHSYGPGTRPYYLMHFVLSGKGRLVVNKTEYQITENQLFLVEPDQMVFYQADKEDPWTYSWVGFNGKLAPYFMHRLGFGYPSLTKELSTEIFEEIKDLLDILISIKNNNTKMICIRMESFFSFFQKSVHLSKIPKNFQKEKVVKIRKVMSNGQFPL